MSTTSPPKCLHVCQFSPYRQNCRQNCFGSVYIIVDKVYVIQTVTIFRHHTKKAAPPIK